MNKSKNIERTLSDIESISLEERKNYGFDFIIKHKNGYIEKINYKFFRLVWLESIQSKRIKQKLKKLNQMFTDNKNKETERLSKIENPFVIENNVLVKYEGLDENVVVPEGVKKIGEYAFYNEHLPTRIKSVILPLTLQEIEKRAFKNFKWNR